MIIKLTTYILVKRFFDLFLCCIFFLPVVVLTIFISTLIVLTSKGPVFYWSSRVGKCNTLFLMPKFRSMYVDTPLLASHLIKNPSNYLTPIGAFIRKCSLDELPQLWSIFIGDMSFVGPRPALFNQDDLIALRNQYGLDKLVPGLTGWAQVNGRDELSIFDKVQYEVVYHQKKSFWFDLKIIGLTFLMVVRRADISH